jgi:hypothetical protein
LRLIGLILVALVIGLTIRYNTFAAWATDSGAYVSAGHAWASGELFTPATFVFWAPWVGDGQVEFPLGHVQGPIKGTITGQYPLGYPLLIAAALKLSGGSWMAPHLVSPLLAGVLVWCAFVLGRQMMTPWAGAMAALLVGATPVVFGHAIMPFSDVPAAAFWAVAWVMSLRAGRGAAAAAGAAAAMAVMIRPNLAPIALVLAATVGVSERGGWKHAATRVAAFGLLGMLGPLLVLWSQAALYGDPLQNGYRVPLSHFFSLERVPYNAGLYPRMLAELHTWIAFAGLFYVPFALRGIRANAATYQRGVIAASALAIIAVNYALMLPYLTYVGWYWLRFLLPALVAMFVLLAAGADHLRLRLAQRWPRVAVLALAPALVVAWAGEEHLDEPVGYERIAMTERYLAEVLPPNAVIMTISHGGAWSVATGRPTIRLDLLAADQLDRAVADLLRRGHHPVFVFDVAIEGNEFTHRFKQARLGRLIWPARAEVTSSSSVVYYDLRDREAFLSGDRWATDVLVGGRSDTALTTWNDLRVEHERIVLPFFEETAAFRSTLDAVYRDDLGRTAASPLIDPGELLRWLRRYVRLRLHRCSHDEALGRVRQQWEEVVEPSLCARPDAINFPPENETMDFRTQLAEWMRERPVQQPPTHVDPLGEVVWMQRYLEARVRGCSHRDATAALTAQITGRPAKNCS